MRKESRVIWNGFPGLIADDRDQLPKAISGTTGVPMIVSQWLDFPLVATMEVEIQCG